MPLLEIRNLTVEFATAAGAFRAVDSFDFSLNPGEICAVVGESGSGKSVAFLALMGLLPWTATITADVMSLEGRDLRNISAQQRRRIIGKDMAMIFQEPMSSLNPCFTRSRKRCGCTWGSRRPRCAGGRLSCSSWWASPTPNAVFPPSRTSSRAG